MVGQDPSCHCEKRNLRAGFVSRISCNCFSDLLLYSNLCFRVALCSVYANGGDVACFMDASHASEGADTIDMIDYEYF